MLRVVLVFIVHTTICLFTYFVIMVRNYNLTDCIKIKYTQIIISKIACFFQNVVKDECYEFLSYQDYHFESETNNIYICN